MKKVLSKYPNLGEPSYFDEIRERILDGINSKYMEFHSGMNFLPKFGKDVAKDRRGLEETKSKKLKLSRKEKFLEEDSFR